MKKTSLVVALIIMATQFGGCSRKSETNQKSETPKSDSSPISAGEKVATSQAPETDSKKQDALILRRIIAEPGVNFDTMNAPMCSLSSIPVSDLTNKLTSQIAGMINWPKNYEPPKAITNTDVADERILADGIFYMKGPSSMEGAGFRCIGKFLLDSNLNPLPGIWDGKKDGAIHTILGKLTMFDYEFVSDETAPLKFKITKDGYVYLEGRGKVKDLKTGSTRIVK